MKVYFRKGFNLIKSDKALAARELPEFIEGEAPEGNATMLLVRHEYETKRGEHIVLYARGTDCFELAARGFIAKNWEL